MSGFGRYVSHLVIFVIALEIYDVYTDITYMLALKLTYRADILFYIFGASLIIAWIWNLIVLIVFLRGEFKYDYRDNKNNNKNRSGSNNNSNLTFTNWFYEHNTIIGAFMVLFLLTDITMVTSVFTSQIFGKPVFYAPMSINGIQMIKISSLFSILFEHIPQFLVQIDVIFYQTDESISINQFATIIVTIIDIVFVVLNGIVCIWVTVRAESLRKKNSMKRTNQQLTTPQAANSLQETLLKRGLRFQTT